MMEESIVSCLLEFHLNGRPLFRSFSFQNRLAALDKENNQTFLLHSLMQQQNIKMNSSNQQLHDPLDGYATDPSQMESEENILCTDSNCEQNYEHQNYENQHKGKFPVVIPKS